MFSEVNCQRVTLIKLLMYYFSVVTYYTFDYNYLLVQDIYLIYILYIYI